jgi:hypothetical protein
MQAQNCCMFPNKYVNPRKFLLKVYNFIIDGLVMGSFNVPINVVNMVVKLCGAIQDALVMLESRVVKNNLPEPF